MLTPRAQVRSAFFAPVTSPSFAASAAWNFSQMRGTPKNAVGRASLIASGTLSIASANHTVLPPVAGMCTVHICSAMCDSGKYETETSPSGRPARSTVRRDVHARFLCDSITPFGGPVVPDV